MTPAADEVFAAVRNRAQTVGVVRRMADGGVPGLCAAVVLDGAPAWSEGRGVACADEGTPVPADTVFQACSLSKPVAALGVMSLVADGLVGLDEDVRTRLDYDIDRHRLYRGPDPAITVRRLLTHRNGIAGRGTTPDRRGRRFVAGGGGSVRFAGTYDRPIPSLEDFWAGHRRRAGVMVTHEPDQQRSYSGLGYLVLEHLCEQLTERPFADWMAERILGPLGMHASTFALDPAEVIDTDLVLACGHDSSGQVLPGRREVCPWAAAAGLYATAADLARFVSCLVNSGRSVTGGQVVAAEAVHEMIAGGLGVTVAGSGAAARFRHTGSNGGFRSILVGYPHQRAGVTVLGNGAARHSAAAVAAVASAAARTYRWPGGR